MGINGGIRFGADPGEDFVGLTQRLGSPLTSLGGGTHGALGPIDLTPGRALVGAGALARLLAPERLLLRRPRSLTRFRHRPRADAEARVPKLALQTTPAGEAAGLVVQCRGAERLRDPLQRRRAELVPGGAEQAPCLARQLIDRTVNLLATGPQSPRVAVAGQHV